jgi:hypothetical protein
MNKTEIEDVVQALSQYSGASTTDILSPIIRGYPAYWLRNTAMYLAERLTSYSLEEIGRYFGHNASDVRCAISAMEREFYDNPCCRAEIEQLERIIRGPEWDCAREWLRSVCEPDSKAQGRATAQSGPAAPSRVGAAHAGGAGNTPRATVRRLAAPMTDKPHNVIELPTIARLFDSSTKRS